MLGAGARPTRPTTAGGDVAWEIEVTPLAARWPLATPVRLHLQWALQRCSLHLSQSLFSTTALPDLSRASVHFCAPLHTPRQGVP